MKPAHGTVETGDRFGSAVAFLSRLTMRRDYYEDRLVVGIPGEDIGRIRNAGAVRLLPLSRYCEHACGSDAYPDDSEAHTLVQGQARTPGAARPGNQFGASLSGQPGVD